MTTQTLSPVLRQKFFDNNGFPLEGGKLFTYSAGTSTKLATYTDSTGATPNPNPVILDFRGEANVWVPANTGYKYILAPATDTDPPTNPIWTVDNVINSQLLTLYGGVDIGSTNAYVLNFVASFTSYTDGIAIYWIPSQVNTGPSTINVNGLGPIAIINQNGSALASGQLMNGQLALIMYIGGQFLLLSTGSVALTNNFNGVITGLTAAVPIAMTYFLNGRMVMLSGAASGTSNSTSMTITGLPVAIRPTQGAHACACLLVDNGVTKGGWAIVAAGTGVITLGIGIDNNAAGFTNTGTKGTLASWTISYPLG